METNGEKFRGVLESKRVVLTGANGRATSASGASDEYIEQIVASFCDRDSLVGIPTADFYNVLDDYCKENGKDLIAKKTVGSFLRRKYGVVAKRVNIGGTTVSVYVKADSPGAVRRMTKAEQLEYAKEKIKELGLTEESINGQATSTIYDAINAACRESGVANIDWNILYNAVTQALNVKQVTEHMPGTERSQDTLIFVAR